MPFPEIAYSGHHISLKKMNSCLILITSFLSYSPHCQWRWNTGYIGRRFTLKLLDFALGSKWRLSLGVHIVALSLDLFQIKPVLYLHILLEILLISSLSIPLLLHLQILCRRQKSSLFKVLFHVIHDIWDYVLIFIIFSARMWAMLLISMKGRIPVWSRESIWSISILEVWVNQLTCLF